MEQETVLKANRILKDIEICKEQIKFFEYSQCENVVEREFNVEYSGSTSIGKIPSSLWRFVGKIALNEWKIKLIELQNEFNEL